MRLFLSMLIVSLTFFNTSKAEPVNGLLYLAQASGEVWIDQASARTVSLDGTEYVHRWSFDNMHEFTPPG